LENFERSSYKASTQHNFGISHSNENFKKINILVFKRVDLVTVAIGRGGIAVGESWGGIAVGDAVGGGGSTVGIAEGVGARSVVIVGRGGVGLDDGGAIAHGLGDDWGGGSDVSGLSNNGSSIGVGSSIGSSVGSSVRSSIGEGSSSSIADGVGDDGGHDGSGVGLVNLVGESVVVLPHGDGGGVGTVSNSSGGGQGEEGGESDQSLAEHFRLSFGFVLGLAFTKEKQLPKLNSDCVYKIR
jgi:hypothetical protein